MSHSKHMRYLRTIRIFVVSLFISLQISAEAADPDPLEAMQNVIDQQRKELDAQNRQLNSQQQRLVKQQKLLESLQSQLHAMAREREGAAGETDSSGEVHQIIYI